MSNFIIGVNEVPNMADLIIVSNKNLECKGLDFGGRKVLFQDGIYGHHDKLEYLKNGYVQNTTTDLLFQQDNKLSEVSLDFSNVTSAIKMFQKCSALNDVNCGSFSSLTNANGMFFQCSALTNVAMGNIHSLSSAQGMFCDCPNLKSVELGNLPNFFKYMFSASSNMNMDLLKVGDLTTATTFFNDGVFNLNSTYKLNIEQVEIGNCNEIEQTDYLFGPEATRNIIIKHIKVGNLPKCHTTANMFANKPTLQTIEMGTIGNGNQVNLYNMFNGCQNLSSVSIANESISVSGRVESAFTNCIKLPTSVYRKFNFNNISGICRNAFDGSSVDYLPISNFDNITNTTYMFRNCKNLKSVSFSSSTSITDCQYMFYGCSGLTDFEMCGSYDSSYYDYFLANCTSLTSLTFDATFNVSKGSTTSLLGNVPLKELYIKNGNMIWNFVLKSVSSTLETIRYKNLPTQSITAFTIPHIIVENSLSGDTKKLIMGDTNFFNTPKGSLYDFYNADGCTYISLCPSDTSLSNATINIHGQLADAVDFGVSNLYNCTINTDGDLNLKSYYQYGGGIPLTTISGTNLTSIQLSNAQSAETLSIKTSATSLSTFSFNNNSINNVEFAIPNVTSFTPYSSIASTATTSLTLDISGLPYIPKALVSGATNVTELHLGNVVPTYSGNVTYRFDNQFTSGMTAVTELYVDSFYGIQGKFANFKNMALSDDSLERIMTAIRNSPIENPTEQSTFIILKYTNYYTMNTKGYVDEALTFGYTIYYQY